MRVRRILQTGAFKPEDVDRLQEAFDIAWRTLAADIPAVDHPASREILATIVVSAGNVSGLDAEELATVALMKFDAVREGMQTHTVPINACRTPEAPLDLRQSRIGYAKDGSRSRTWWRATKLWNQLDSWVTRFRSH